MCVLVCMYGCTGRIQVCLYVCMYVVCIYVSRICLHGGIVCVTPRNIRWPRTYIHVYVYTHSQVHTSKQPSSSCHTQMPARYTTKHKQATYIHTRTRVYTLTNAYIKTALLVTWHPDACPLLHNIRTPRTYIHVYVYTRSQMHTSKQPASSRDTQMPARYSSKC